MFSRARIRLTLWFAGVFALIIAVIGVAVMFSARTALYSQIDDDLSNRAAPIVNSFRQGPFEPSLVAQFTTPPGYFYALIGPGGEPLPGNSFAIDDVELPPKEDLENATEGDGSGYLDAETTEGDSLRIFVRRGNGPAGQTYYFELGRSIEPEQEALQRLLLILIAGGAAGMLLAGWGGYLLAGLALRPIKKSVELQKVFVADASHELRTPLALIRANAEMLKRQAGEPPDMNSVDDIIKESDRLSYLVGQMLTLARADSAELKFESNPVDLARVVEDIGRQMKLLASERGVTLTVEAGVDCIALGDEQRLGELLIILLDNAVKYTDSGGSVRAQVERAGKSVRLAVQDTGRGIPAADLPRVFDRFYRSDKARSREMGGTGLGLAIAQWIVDQHRGSVSAESVVGEGTTVTVSLPAAEMPVMDDVEDIETPGFADVSSANGERTSE